MYHIGKESAINGATLEVKFTKAVDKDEAQKVDADGNSTVVTLEDAALKNPTLSEDGKTLTLTAPKAIVADKAKLVVNEVASKDNAKEKTAKYTTLFTFKDTVAPTAVSAKAAIAKVSETNTKSVTVKFSEPVQTSAIATINGTTAAVTAGDKTDELTLTSTKELKAGDAVEVKLTNVKDIAGNAIAPNPTTISTTVQAADTVAPTIASVETKGANQVVVSYDKDVDAATVKDTAYLSISGNKVATLAKTSVEDNKVTYTATDVTGAKFSELFTKTNPTVSATLFIPKEEVSDKAGNKLANDYSTSVSFEKDFVAPTLVSSTVVDNKLVLNFSEAVKLVDDKKATDFKLAATNLTTGKTDTASAFELVDAPATGKVVNTTISEDKKTVTIDLNSNADTEKELSFVASYTNALFTDLSGNAAATFTDTITLAKKAAPAPEADKTAPTITLDAAEKFVDVTANTTVTNTDYTLTYTISDDTALDFTSIRNVNNYTIAGQALPTGTVITTSAATTAEKDNVEVTITIPKKSVTETLKGVLAISGIKDAAGNTISGILTTDTAEAGLLTLTEGVAPKVTSALAVLEGGVVEADLTDGVAFTIPTASKTSVIKVNFDEALKAGQFDNVDVYVTLDGTTFAKYGDLALVNADKTLEIKPLTGADTMGTANATFVFAADDAVTAGTLDTTKKVTTVKDANDNELTIPTLKVTPAK